MATGKADDRIEADDEAARVEKHFVPFAAFVVAARIVALNVKFPTGAVMIDLFH